MSIAVSPLLLVSSSRDIYMKIGLTIRQFWKRRRQFNDVLSSSRNLNQSRYFRLMALAGIELLGTIPLASYSIYLNVTTNQIQEWKGWADTHSNFSRVQQIPAVLWRLNRQEMISVELSRWLLVLCAFIFFFFFGFADEARKHYRLAYTSLASRLGVSTISSSTVSSEYVCPSALLFCQRLLITISNQLQLIEIPSDVQPASFHILRSFSHQA